MIGGFFSTKKTTCQLLFVICLCFNLFIKLFMNIFLCRLLIFLAFHFRLFLFLKDAFRIIWRNICQKILNAFFSLLLWNTMYFLFFINFKIIFWSNFLYFIFLFILILKKIFRTSTIILRLWSIKHKTKIYISLFICLLITWLICFLILFRTKSALK